MKKCVILDDYQNAALRAADWSRLKGRIGIGRVGSYLNNEDDVVQQIGGAEIIVVMRERTPLPARLLERLPHLRLIVTSGMRNAAIDLDAAHAKGITVCGTASSPLPPLELTWGLILGLARNILPEAENLRRNGPWQSSVGVDLAGARLGIVGLGKIGARMAAIAQAFGMEVTAWSPNLTEERAAAANVARASSKEALLETSDFVSLHLVLSPTTRGLIGADDLRRMKPTAFLVNTARAAIVDESALVTALREKWIAGAGLDVFETEPLPPEHPFRSLPNVLATPHLGYVSENNYRTFFEEGVEDIEAWLDGRPIRTLT
ncbi:MAG TPA: D-2-hydroxyacid dehydrogenase family protein [Candidatus Sulfotelmatobacter sp.]|nr:D-2-hydroxyacid dehydrogenase family protein [Candidatus Sulfotelmatobacter sp.]